VKKRLVQKKTCFLLGVFGAVLLLAAGLLMVLSRGPAQLLQMASFALTGGMLLFLAVQERGPNKTSRRTKWFGLFLLLLAGYLGLPLLDLAEIPVLPLMLVMVWQKRHVPLLVGLLLAEVAFGALRTLAITPLLGPTPALWVGIGMMVLGAVRGLACGVLYRQYARQAEETAVRE